MATYAPSRDDIERLAGAAPERLPELFRQHLGGVILRVEEFADEDVLRELGAENPFEISGLYTGRPVGEKSSDLSGALPDMIHLYRRPILDEWAEQGESLETLVTHIVVHEVGHHFGLSDDAMHAIEEAASEE